MVKAGVQVREMLQLDFEYVCVTKHVALIEGLL